MISFNAKISGAKTQLPEAEYVTRNTPTKSSLRTKPPVVGMVRCNKPAYLTALTVILVTLLCLIAFLVKRQPDSICSGHTSRHRRLGSKDDEKRADSGPVGANAGASSDSAAPCGVTISLLTNPDPVHDTQWKQNLVKYYNPLRFPKNTPERLAVKSHVMRLLKPNELRNEYATFKTLKFDSANELFRDSDSGVLLDGITRPIMAVTKEQMDDDGWFFELQDSRLKEFKFHFPEKRDCVQLLKIILKARDTFTPMCYRGFFEYLLDTKLNPQSGGAAVPNDFDYTKNLTRRKNEQLTRRYENLDVSTLRGRAYFSKEFQSVYRQTATMKRNSMKEKPNQGIFTMLLRKFVTKACEQQEAANSMKNAEPLYLLLADLEKLSERLVNAKNFFEDHLRKSSEKNPQIWLDLFQVAVEKHTQNNKEMFLHGLARAAYPTERVRIEKFVTHGKTKNDILKGMMEIMETRASEKGCNADEVKELMETAEEWYKRMKALSR